MNSSTFYSLDQSISNEMGVWLVLGLNGLISIKKILFNILKCLEPHLIFKMVASSIMVLESLYVLTRVAIHFLFQNSLTFP